MLYYNSVWGGIQTRWKIISTDTEKNVGGQNFGTTIKLTLFGASIKTLTVTKKLTIGRSPKTISV